ncbi:DEAD/DEAH box helicase family protein [Shewanella xiamenensis]|uniref:DEAD/DEAH box helicase family protein n=1 Tax=Shewanella xiamenensis TaxID=332186 RepID=UPI00313B5E80
MESNQNSLLDYHYKDTYSTDTDDILSDFYIPALKRANQYRRAVGYFSTTALLHISQGLYGLLKKQGHMQLIVGAPLTIEEYEVMKKAQDDPVSSICYELLREIVLECENGIGQARLKLFLYMLSSRTLEIRFAIKKHGMYHEKIGIISDESGREISFIGSANETGMAISGKANSESISVYKSSDSEIYQRFGKPLSERFDNLWNNLVDGVKVIKPNDRFIEKVVELSNQYASLSEIDKVLKSEAFSEGDLNFIQCDMLPKIPLMLGSESYKLKKHQEKAIRDWQRSNFKGIMALATGAGKTITALHLTTKLALTNGIAKGVSVIIAVPYQSLAEQWLSVMQQFNMNPILCYMGKKNWEDTLKEEIIKFKISQDRAFLSIVVVNATLVKDEFQSLLKKLPVKRTIFISDECHHHSAKKYLDKIPDCNFKLGLSATPWDDEGSNKSEILKEIYGEVISEFSLEEAMKLGVLCPYRYFVVDCYMDDSEAVSYIEISRKIARLESIKASGELFDEKPLTMLYLKRTRLLGAIKDKYDKLDAILKKSEVKRRSLFYCGEGAADSLNDELYSDEKVDSIINSLTVALYKNGYKSSRFTSEETALERRKILKSFRDGDIDALVSKRVLDEGIDIPDCRTAFILASSSSPRQYIQRRGRLLRNSIGKTHADIYDFIVNPPSSLASDPIFNGLRERESARVEDFKSIAKECIYVN